VSLQSTQTLLRHLHGYASVAFDPIRSSLFGAVRCINHRVIDDANLPRTNADKSTRLPQIAGPIVLLSVTRRVERTMACEKHEAQPDSKDRGFHMKTQDRVVGRPRSLLSSRVLSFLCVFGVLVLAIYSNSVADMNWFNFVAILSTLGTAVAKPCHLTTVQTSVPSNGSEIALQSYSYCGGKLNITVSQLHLLVEFESANALLGIR
jgi:hypothetical protein